MRDPGECLRVLAGLAGVRADARAVLDWGGIERDLGVRLPADYKLLAERFPPGWFRKFVRLAGPEDGRGAFPGDLSRGGVTKDLRNSRARGRGEVPYPVYPEPGGLLPWGSIWEEGTAFWLTEPAGEPGEWPVVIRSEVASEGGFDAWRRFDGPACDFLIEVAAGRFDTAGFIEGPIDIVIDGTSERRSGHPIVLAERPVFQPDVPLREPEPPRPRVPGAGYWVERHLRLGGSPAGVVAALREALGPPPAGVAPADWGQVEPALGTRLPADYREFVDSYGPGWVGDVRVMAPGGPGDWDLAALLDRKYRQVRDLERTSVGDPPFHPEPGGTVSWGETADGWTCCWAPAGADPGGWPVVALMPTWNLRGYVLSRGLSFSQVLLRHVEGEEDLFPRRLGTGPVRFRPASA